MNPILAQSIAQARIEELIAEADAYRLASAARRRSQRSTGPSRVFASPQQNLHVGHQPHRAASA